MPVRNLRRVNQFLAEHQEFSPGQLRWLIHRARDNGLEAAGAIVRPPNQRVVFLDVDRFFAWLAGEPLDEGAGEYSTTEE